MWDAFTSGAMPQAVFGKLRDRLTADRAAAREALAAARSNLPTKANTQTHRATLHSALNAITDPTAPPREVNLLLKQCIDSITYSRPRKKSTNRRYGTPEPMELDITLRI